MKKKLTLVLLLFLSMSMFAREKEHSLGFNVGSLYGFTYKWKSANKPIAFQMDYGFKIGTMGKALYTYSFEEYYNGQYYDYSGKEHLEEAWAYVSCELSPMLMWEPTLVRRDWGDLDLYFGAGPSLGCLVSEATNIADIEWDDPYLKCGANVVLGMELAFRKMGLSFDFRPGYGFATRFNDYQLHFFDWSLNMGLHFAL